MRARAGREGHTEPAPKPAVGEACTVGCFAKPRMEGPTNRTKFFVAALVSRGLASFPFLARPDFYPRLGSRAASLFNMEAGLFRT